MVLDRRGRMSRADCLSAAEARRLALAAQGLDKAGNAARTDIRHLRRALSRIGVLQLDFVNVLVPAHLMVLYSRIGAYDPEAFRRLVYERGEFIEQWAHEASVVPVEAWPLLAHRRAAFRQHPNSPVMRMRNRRKYLRQCIEIVKEKGPITSGDLPPVKGPRRRPGDWHRSIPRWALEHHFGRGDLAIHDRLANFQRVYDLPERVINEAALGRSVDEPAAQRALLLSAARACGVATERDLADYFRMSPTAARPRLEELAEEGAIRPAAVEGWNQAAWLADGAGLPSSADRAVLLSPFDPLIWFRERTERLFDFHYRIEIYVPARKRRWGYYVLPFLMNDRLAARVDLKADRAARVLRVPAAHLEDGADETATARALAAELAALADWLGLSRVTVGRRGAFAAALRKAVRDENTRR